MQEIHISMEEDTLLVCRKTGKTGEDSNPANSAEHRLLMLYKLFIFKNAFYLHSFFRIVIAL